MPEVLDITGTDIYPLIRDAGRDYDLDPVAILAMLIAESGLNPYAAREGIWPDVSYGFSQLIVSTAAGYGVGNGMNTPSNRETVKMALFDRRNSIRLGARHLAGNFAYVDARIQTEGDVRALLALRVYNGGAYGLSDRYELDYPANLASYKRALREAHELLDNQGDGELDKHTQREVKNRLQDAINQCAGISDSDIADAIRKDMLEINDLLSLPDFSQLEE